MCFKYFSHRIIREGRNMVLVNVRLLLVCCLFAIVCASGLKANDDTGISVLSDIKQFTISEGLSNGSVTCLFQDSRGFLWIGTKNGLNRFDGKKFLTYRHIPVDSLSISGNYIQVILETTDGNIWVGTKNNGISVWDRRTDCFSRFNNSSHGERALPEDEILGMVYDKKWVWALSLHYLIKIDGVTNQVKYFNTFHKVLKTARYHQYPLLKISYDEILIGTKEGLQSFNIKTETFTRIQFEGVDSSNDIGDLVMLNDSSVLVSTIEGVKLCDIKNQQIKLLEEERREPYYLPSNVSIHNGMIWLSSQNSIQVAGIPGYSFKELEGSFLGKWPLKNQKITAQLFDNSGLLWIGTERGGLFKINLQKPKIRSISSFDKLAGEFESYDICAIHADRSYYWLGTRSKGLYRVGKKDERIKHYCVSSTSDGLSEDLVSSILEVKDNILWLGTNKGIFILNKETDRIEEFSYADSSEFATILKSNYIRDLLQDKLGNIWIATQFGLYKYNGHELTRYFEDPNDKNSLCSDVVNVLFEDSEGWLWVGTKKGVNIIQNAWREFVQISNSDLGSKLLSNNYILSFVEDKDKRIWIGTQAGLSYYDKKSFSPGFIKDEKDLSNIQIGDLLRDEYDRIWLSSNRGISYINPVEGMIYFTEEDGLPGYSYHSGAALKTDDELLFGGANGLAIINPDSLRINLSKPNVEITGVNIIHKGKELSSFHGEVDSIEMKFKNNSMIRVEFSALEFTQPSKNRYKVMLDGYDETWRDVTSENSVVFSNLMPGSYTLKVMGANNDFVWNNNPTELFIKIVPPLYMSNYAYAFYLLAAIFIIQSLINYRIRNYRKVYKDLQEKATSKKQIEDQRETLSKINQSLTDSISYAKRIQEAIIPSEQMFRRYFSESFIYFRPKDIVSGDFYWVYQNKDKIFVAAVDCTGHGVPGAFMSIIGYDLLRNIVEIQGEECPAVILNRLNREVLSIFKRNNSNQEEFQFGVKDGMDMAFCMIDKKRKNIEFAGAFNPIYLIRDNEILSYKGNRFAIGHHGAAAGLTFTKQEIPLQENDIIYLFSDGYADQFGGPEGKKFKYRRFRHLLLNIHKLPIEDQKAILHQKMEEWMNGQHEQVDDILLMGLRPLK
ncbi:serine/threonine protein phosphatase [Marinilabiliaceae bacterium JC017]|nr:serine/threonine protein phosphatase [Marinilabiliaceae bacterium JC017]